MNAGAVPPEARPCGDDSRYRGSVNLEDGREQPGLGSSPDTVPDESGHDGAKCARMPRTARTTSSTSPAESFTERGKLTVCRPMRVA